MTPCVAMVRMRSRIFLLVRNLSQNRSGSFVDQKLQWFPNPIGVSQVICHQEVRLPSSSQARTARIKARACSIAHSQLLLELCTWAGGSGITSKRLSYVKSKSAWSPSPERVLLWPSVVLLVFHAASRSWEMWTWPGSSDAK